jgi:hypothetical protein
LTFLLENDSWMGRARARLVSAFALALSCLSLAGRAEAEPEQVARFALVLGNNRAPNVETLRYADDDALGMHRLFQDANVDSRLLATFDGTTRELHPHATPKGPATLGHLEREMAAVRAQIRTLRARGITTEFYFFYSGHGDVEGGEGRLMLEDHALTRGELYELLEASGASQNHVFLDACSSFMVASKRADAQRRQPVDSGFARRQTPDELGNVGFVLSSSSDRESHEWERYEAGIVSHELRSGLRGAADADLDGRITYAELAAFLQRANTAIDIPRLRPDPFVVPPGRNWQRPVLSWRPETAMVRVRGGAIGHFFVENARGERLLDAHPGNDQWLHLHLPADRPLFIRDHDRPAEHEVAGLAPTDVSLLEPVASALRRAKGAEQLALQRLFAAPFARDHVLEYQRTLSLGSPATESAAGERPSPWLRPLGYTALAAAAVGGAFSALALVTYWNAGDATQIEAERANRRMARYHLMSVVPYATAATAGVLWGWLKLGSVDTPSASVRLTPGLALREVWLGLDGRF